MPNIQGIIGYAVPGAYSISTTKAGAVALPGGPTVVCILGNRGQTEERLVARALGEGQDGLPINFTFDGGPDGRHFQLGKTDLVSGSVELFLNPIGDGSDIPLARVTGVGDPRWDVDNDYAGTRVVTQDGYNEALAKYPGANIYKEEFTGSDGLIRYRIRFIDPSNTAADPVFGMSFPTEKTYTLDAYQGLSKTGYDGYHGVGPAGSVEPQHYYLDETTGQIILDQPLNFKDSLFATYIAEADINDPEVFFDPDVLYAKYGFPSTYNNVSLAAQLAFENGAAVVMACLGGLTWSGTRWVQDPQFVDAFQKLKAEDLDILVPITDRRILNEIVVASYVPGVAPYDQIVDEKILLDPLGGSDAPGTNLPVNSDLSQVNVVVRKNSQTLTEDVDYTLAVVSQSLEITLTDKLVWGDKVAVDYNTSLDLLSILQVSSKNHVEFMSSTAERRERIMFTGPDTYDTIAELYSALIDSTTGVEATFGDSYRVMYLAPTNLQRVVNGQLETLPGMYMGASAAGLAAGNSYLAEPLTNKTIIGFTLPKSQKFTRAQISILGGAGVALVTPLAAGGKVIHGQSTSNSGNAVEEEISITRARDYVAKATREVLEAQFVGKTIQSTTIKDVETVTNAILSSLISQKLILDKANVKVSQDQQEPRQVNVSFDINPIFPLNWIKIEFSVGLL